MRPGLCALALLPLIACRGSCGCPGDRVGAGAGGTARDVGAEEDADAPVPPPLPIPEPRPRPSTASAELTDDFSGATLDLARWVPFIVNDVRESATEITDVGQEGSPDRRLTLGASTIGTDDATVKTVGVRTVQAFDFQSGKRFSVDIDWNDPRNPAYLTAAIYLCPTVAAGNPEDERDWVKFEYVGVPQDGTVRTVIARKRGGSRRWLDRGSWPEVRTGKVVKRNRIEISIDAADLVIHEAGKERFRLPEHQLGFTRAVVYLLMTTHSNYPRRTILFDDVEVAKADVPR